MFAPLTKSAKKFILFLLLNLSKEQNLGNQFGFEFIGLVNSIEHMLKFCVRHAKRDLVVCGLNWR